MSEPSQAAQVRTPTNTLGIGILVILWITAVFIIVVLNGMRAQLDEMNSKMQSLIRMQSMANMGNFQMVGPEQAADGTSKVLAKFERRPELDMVDPEMMDPSMTMTPEAAATGGRAAKPAAKDEHAGHNH